MGVTRSERGRVSGCAGPPEWLPAQTTSLGGLRGRHRGRGSVSRGRGNVNDNEGAMKNGGTDTLPGLGE